ncbi:MAG: hypothetical protein DIU76_11255 [Bacillota bacterium]|nr:MAG: hypothetical protein DIU76_11255 [Bacillota bacterium]
MLLLGWLLIFTGAWIFPYAWRWIGTALGALWGFMPLLAEMVRRWWQDADLILFVVAGSASPFTAGAAALGLPTGGVGFWLASLAAGTLLGLLFAWTGYAFRLFH